MNMTSGHKWKVRAPAEKKSRRDSLGWLCFGLHLLMVTYAALGWLIPSTSALIAYLVYIPAMFLQWQLNADACILNNLENLIRHGRWRNPVNREEGAFLKTLLEDATGMRPSKRQVNLTIYCLISLFWIFGLGHLVLRSQT